jgi:multidrug efflux system outer membrane protein
MLLAGGARFRLLAALLYAPGTWLHATARREQRLPLFNARERPLSLLPCAAAWSRSSRCPRARSPLDSSEDIAMKIRLVNACITAALATLFSACTVGPNYVRPTVETAPGWRIDYPKAADVANLKWWEQFGDPVLNQLVETALRDNRDLRVAAARVDQFIGALTTTGSQLYPQIGYGADASRARASEVGFPPLSPALSPYFSLYNVSLGASWQADLFGRVRRQTEAAQAQVYASEQGQRGVVLTLVAGVATSYIVLRSLDRQLEISQATARNFEDTLRIFELRFKSGLIAMTELAQIRSQTQQARAAIPQFQQAIATQENLLSILLGSNPGPIPRGKTIDQLVAPAIPGDLPAALLQRRPDILGAEQNLVAANANIGAARALYYPNLSLQAALATTAAATGALFSGPAAAGLIGAALTGPIFTFGAIEGQVAAAEAGERAALAVYQQTILNALREANDALSGSQKRAEEFSLQRERVVALREFARLSKLRFDKGVSGYLEVLVAENELFAAELASVSLQASSYAQIVNVYQAVGGGWVDIAAGMAPKPLAAAKANPS